MAQCSACQRIDLSETPHSRLQLLRHYPPGRAATGRTLERHAYQCAVCDCIWIKETRNVLEPADGQRPARWRREMQWVLMSRPVTAGQSPLPPAAPCPPAGPDAHALPGARARPPS